MKNYLTALLLLPLLIACGGGDKKTTNTTVKQISRTAPLDPLIGDYQGELDTKNGKETLCAQVIAYKDGKYTANLLSKFDTRGALLIKLEGQKQEDGAVVFSEDRGDGMTWQASIAEKGMAGTVKGKKDGKFLLKKVVRLSPDLGKKPPKGAIVLFDGSSLDKWKQTPEPKGYVNLARLVGGDYRCAYIKTVLFSKKAQQAVLELGSDDGMKVWLNGKTVFTVNKHRGAKPAQDKVDVSLQKGWNELLIKVTNDNGAWGAYAGVSGADGILVSPLGDQEKAVELSDGFIPRWLVSDAYKQAGKDAVGLFDIVFPPEKGNAGVKWADVDITKYDDKPRWEIVEGGAMQVRPGSRSIYTRQKFWNYRLHLEFRSPFMPNYTGQSRGNSGVYNLCRYEVQVLDSYGLEGKDNECGGIYKIAAPLVNMCAPPMQWQSYDITFTAPKFDKKGKKIANARITVIQNGVKIHDNLELPFPTAGAFIPDESKPAGIFLQDHGDPVQYRNIWIVDLGDK